ncbi:MAG TPA: gluconate 2-dehydrogenase subunit 3 family protein [Gemmatimonadales bacterium]|nr:gluconate 2-dehydrogenase subunit 3 family protein [Gemmatimonadales bacterium]
MTEINRREALRILGLIPLLAAGISPAEVARAAESARRALGSSGFTPAFFTGHEYATVRVLAELVIPRDDRSGGALDAGVPEFIDFILHERQSMQTPIRGGLAWLDAEAVARFGHEFVDILDVDRRAILDGIAWPKKAKPEHSQGVAFFNEFRDLVASGYFSSRMGVEDLRYVGNRVVGEWTGCPPEALAKLGVG